MRFYFFIFCLISSKLYSQTLGGNAAFNFLKLPTSALQTAAGGMNVSYKTNEVGFTLSNPSLLHPQLHQQVHTSFSNFLGGIKYYSLGAAYHLKTSHITVAGGIHYLDYGSIPQTDAAGNFGGEFRLRDFSIQASASKKYMNNWNYGVTAKFIQSSYQQFSSNALAFDVGVLYLDSSAGISASFVAKNMGVQLKSYSGEKEDLPFDLQIGVTKKLSNAPFAFSLTAYQVHQFNISYNDTTFNRDNNFSDNDNTFNKIFNHFVFASHIFLGKNLEATIGYNHLRRNELSTGISDNGLTGFSAGIRLKFQKLQVLYSRSAYQRNIAYNQFGLTLHLDQLTGLDK